MLGNNTVEPNPERARMFAEIAHSGQTYEEEVPYTYHLDGVVATLKEHGFTDAVMVCAGYLHDVMEDTNKNYNDIKSRFGEPVAELVYAVTNELGRNREERNKKTYPKIAGTTEPLALKLADRITNVKYGMLNGSGMYLKYKKEYPEFRKALRSIENEDKRVTTMWDHLGRLLGVRDDE